MHILFSKSLLHRYVHSKHTLGQVHTLIWVLTILIQASALVVTLLVIFSSYSMVAEKAVQTEKGPVEKENSMAHPAVAICVDQDLDRYVS